jgi:hypothetical protein
MCIDKRNSAELSESIISMHRWYQSATICFAYLSDYPSTEVASITQSVWFRRGWTLQELVAPTDIEFFDQRWNPTGGRDKLREELSRRTGIASAILSRRVNDSQIAQMSLSHRMSWFQDRQCTKPEDAAYCLMGLFGVNLPALYGEGLVHAFRRLQEEIIKYSDDQSLFAWTDKEATDDGESKTSAGYGLLAPSPACFANTGHYVYRPDGQNDKPFALTNKGLEITLRMFQDKSPDVWIACLECRVDGDHFLAIFLKRVSSVSEQYCRIRPNIMCKVPKDSRGEPKTIYVKQRRNF